MTMANDIWSARRPAEATRSSWRFYPLAIVAAMGFVFLVNAGMIWTALKTFPGAASDNGFDESNTYNGVLAAAAQEKALGWQIATAMRDGRAEIVLSDRRGHALDDAVIAAEATRPLGPENATTLGFSQAGEGIYRAGAALPLAGQWDLALRITEGGKTIHLTRRVVAP